MKNALAVSCVKIQGEGAPTCSPLLTPIEVKVCNVYTERDRKRGLATFAKEWTK